MNSDSIPTDLILEILSRLPRKSVARFRCVSKQWASTLGRPYFRELFLTRSSAKPRLLFAVEELGTWSIFSLPQRQNPYRENPSSSSSSSSSLVVAAEFQTFFPGEDMRIHHDTDLERFSCCYASGLIYFNRMTSTIKGKYYDGPVIFDPNTNTYRYLTLPSLGSYPVSTSYSFFGFDPIDKQFKVLLMAIPYGYGHDHRIITLETGMRWRKIECSLRHYKKSEGICINGVLYYLGETLDYEESQLVIVCFDVRYESFKFIDVEWYSYQWSPYELINYKGKLGVVSHYYTQGNNVIELALWVLENVEKQEWSEYAYTLSKDQFFHRRFTVVGATASGEIVFSVGTYASYELPFYVFYFNPERKTFQSVEIQGFGDYLISTFSHHVYTFVDHVEDLNVKITFKKKKKADEKEKIETVIGELAINH